MQIRGDGNVKSDSGLASEDLDSSQYCYQLCSQVGQLIFLSLTPHNYRKDNSNLPGSFSEETKKVQ